MILDKKVLSGNQIKKQQNILGDDLQTTFSGCLYFRKGLKIK